MRPPTPANRLQTLEGRRTLKMASSAHAYVRGSTAQFYRWLEERGERAVPKARPFGSAETVTREIWGRSPQPTEKSMCRSAISIRR
jgi:hypothetical protein